MIDKKKSYVPTKGLAYKVGVLLHTLQKRE